MYLITIHTFSLMKCLLKSIPIFYWVDCFLLLSFKSSLCILDKSRLLKMWFTNIFCQSIDCLSIVLTVSVADKNFKFWLKTGKQNPRKPKARTFIPQMQVSFSYSPANIYSSESSEATCTLPRAFSCMQWDRQDKVCLFCFTQNQTLFQYPFNKFPFHLHEFIFVAYSQ